MEEKYFLVRDLEKSQGPIQTPGYIIYSELFQCTWEPDTAGIRRIYSAVLDWEKRISVEESPEESRELACSALDLLCCAADYYYDSLGDDSLAKPQAQLVRSAFENANLEPEGVVGKIRGFLRTELGYCQLPKEDWLSYFC